jgi:hypothetical protein
MVGFVAGQLLLEQSAWAQGRATQRANNVAVAKTTQQDERLPEQIDGMAPEAAYSLIERLVVLISDTKAHPDKRARGCEYVSRFGSHAGTSVPAISTFIEQQLAAGTVKYFFHEKPTSTIVYPAGTALRLGKAAAALGEIGPSAVETLPVLSKLALMEIRELPRQDNAAPASDVAPSPQAIAAEAIGKIGQPQSLQVLIDITNHDPNVNTRIGAVRGLAYMTRSSDMQIALSAQSQLKVVAATDSATTAQQLAEQVLGNLAKAQADKAKTMVKN